MTAPQQSVPSSPQVSQPTFLTDASGAPITGSNSLPVTGSFSSTNDGTFAKETGGNLATLAGAVSGGKMATKAASGDFAAGSLVDLATLLTLAGTPTDANTVNSLMGRLTKLRDLLNAVAYDNTNELRVSLYGKASAAGDTSLLLDSLGQMTTEQFIQYQIMQGHGFSATTGQVATSAANAFVCMQLAVNAISKRVLIYSINIGNATGAETDGRLYLANAATADSNLTTSLTAYNLQPKSATASALTTLTGSPASTTQTSGFQGNQVANWISAANTNIQILANNQIVYFANGDTASMEVAQKKTTSTNTCSISISWIEW